MSVKIDPAIAAIASKSMPVFRNGFVIWNSKTPVAKVVFARPESWDWDLRAAKQFMSCWQFKKPRPKEIDEVVARIRRPDALHIRLEDL